MISKSKLWSSCTMAMLFVFACGLNSCKKTTDPISGQVSASVSNEATQDSMEDEIDDITSNQMQAVSQIPGRVSSIEDIRVACAKVTVIVGDKQGKILINFDSTSTAAAPNGCKDALGNTRQGQISIVWNGGHWYTAGSQVMITLTNYSINGVVINGQRTLGNITDPAKPAVIIWTVDATGTIFTWPDNTSATRSVAKIKTWDVIEGTLNVSQNTTQSFAVTGTDREGTSYTVVINSDIVYTVQCAIVNKVFIPVRGNKTLTLNGTAALTFDYGAGTCDNTFTVMYNGKTDTINASNSGS